MNKAGSLPGPILDDDVIRLVSRPASSFNIRSFAEGDFNLRVAVRTWGHSSRPCCMEILQDAFGRRRRFDHATRTNFARPSAFLRLSDLTAIATSVAGRASWRDFSVSPMTRL